MSSRVRIRRKLHLTCSLRKLCHTYAGDKSRPHWLAHIANLPSIIDGDNARPKLLSDSIHSRFYVTIDRLYKCYRGVLLASILDKLYNTIASSSDNSSSNIRLSLQSSSLVFSATHHIRIRYASTTALNEQKQALDMRYK